MNNSKERRVSRKKRQVRVRKKVTGSVERPRLCVFRSAKHIYAQIIGAEGGSILASASTLDKDLRAGKTGNVEAAQAVGKLIADRAKAAGVEKVAFDRSGFKYHGRVKALADGARKGGLEF